LLQSANEVALPAVTMVAASSKGDSNKAAFFILSTLCRSRDLVSISRSIERC
jgi:hypothetical protein